MVTAVISDLHLGTRTKADLLARPEVRERLIVELESVDQVVLLGDSIELRDGPLSEALATAAPFFEDLGQALSGRRVTLVPGNHDYQLASRWLARRGPRPLALEELSAPLQGDPLDSLAKRMSGTELVLAYPGVWLRPDVYATHGHYLDCHNDVRTFECLARAAVERLTRAPRNGYSTPDDYEAVLAPVYKAIYRVAQSRRARHAARAGKAARPLVGAAERLSGPSAASGRGRDGTSGGAAPYRRRLCAVRPPPPRRVVAGPGRDDPAQHRELDRRRQSLPARNLRVHQRERPSRAQAVALISP